MIARDVSHISLDEANQLLLKADDVHRLLQGLITKSKTFLIPKS